MKLAVIDIGTNSIHMLVGEILPNFTFEVIGREKEMIRLGDGTLATGYLSDEQIELGVETLKKFKYLAQSKGASKFLAVATSAVREAHNGGDFLKRIIKETGIKVRIITGEEEGRLIYQGVKHSMHLKEGNTLIIDIGGGSVELMVVNPNEILFLQSLKLGAARLTDRFLKKTRDKDFNRLEKFAESELAEAVTSIKEIGFQEVIGTAGTINNLVAMAFYEINPSAASVDRNPKISKEELSSLYRRLKNSQTEDRLEIKGLDSRRSDIILGGAGVLSVLFRELQISELVACDKAIREGMIYRYIAKNRRKIRSEVEIPNVRRRSVLKLAHQCDFEREHAQQTARLALQIFDRTQALHQLSSLDRELLDYAALLHDIGYSISYEKHHRHSFYLIKNVAMNGFTEEEVQLMALMALYHRRSNPKKNHPQLKGISKGVRRRLRWLAGILKIADALDRSHFSVVQTVRVRTYGHKVIFQVEATDDAEYEIWEAEHKCNLFAKLAKREVEFKAKRVKKPKPAKGRTKTPAVAKIKAL